MAEVTDPTLLSELNAGSRKEVTDPALLSQLEGTSKPTPTWGETAVDVGKQVLSFPVAGVEMGLTSPAQILDLAGRGVEHFFPPSEEKKAEREQLRKAIEENPLGSGRKGVAQYLPDPKTGLGKYVRTGGEFATGMAMAPGRLAVNIPAGIAGGLASEAAGQATEGTSGETAARIAAGVAGTLVPAASARTINRLRGYRQAPTPAQIDEYTDALYGQLREHGASFPASGVSNAIGEIKKSIDQHPEVAPRTFALLNEKQREFAPTAEKTSSYWDPKTQTQKTVITEEAAEKAPLTFDDIDALRRNLRYLGKDRTEGAAARQAQRGLDDYLASVPDKEVSRLAQQARAEAAAGFRVEALENLKERAAIRAQSGINPEAALRGELRAFILPDRKTRTSPAMREGFNKQEIAEMRKAMAGFNFRGLVSFLGRYGGTMGLGGAGAYGYFSHDPSALAPMALAYGSRHLGAALQRTNMNRLGRMAATRSPLAVEMGVRPPPRETGNIAADIHGIAKPQLYVDNPMGFKKGGRVTRSFRIKN